MIQIDLTATRHSRRAGSCPDGALHVGQGSSCGGRSRSRTGWRKFVPKRTQILDKKTDLFARQAALSLHGPLRRKLWSHYATPGSGSRLLSARPWYRRPCFHLTIKTRYGLPPPSNVHSQVCKSGRGHMSRPKLCLVSVPGTARTPAGARNV